MDTLNKRNTETVEQVLKTMNLKIEDQQIRIDGLLNALSIAISRIETLEKSFLLQKLASIGHGPSVK